MFCLQYFSLLKKVTAHYFGPSPGLLPPPPCHGVSDWWRPTDALRPAGEVPRGANFLLSLMWKVGGAPILRSQIHCSMSFQRAPDRIKADAKVWASVSKHNIFLPVIIGWLDRLLVFFISVLLFWWLSEFWMVQSRRTGYNRRFGLGWLDSTCSKMLYSLRIWEIRSMMVCSMHRYRTSLWSLLLPGTLLGVIHGKLAVVQQ